MMVIIMNIYTGHFFNIVRGGEVEGGTTSNPILFPGIYSGGVMEEEEEEGYTGNKVLDEPLEMVGVVSSILLAAGVISGKLISKA